MKDNERKTRFHYLSFPFNNFSESGLFKGLRPKKIEKFPSPAASRSGCGRAAFG
jgi:hypothetical protein